MNSFLAELKRRKMAQVAAVYAVVAWLLVQIVVAIKAPLRLPDWADTLVIVLLAIGFPITMVMSWAFNLTPEGLVRDRGAAKTPTTGGRTIEYVLIGLLIAAVGWIGYRVEFGPPEPVAMQPVAGSESPSAETTRLPNSVAVLPFASLSLDPENEFFAEGIHDELLNQLAQVSGLNVIARTSVMQYAKTEKSISDIASELNVETVMEGTIRYGKEHIRLTAQLIDPDTGTHLWSNTYDRDFNVADIFEIESDIASKIARKLETTLSPSERARLEAPLTRSTDAWARYLQAMALMNYDLKPWLPPDSVAQFHSLLDEAIRIDPAFAAAHAAKAVQYAFYMATPKPISDQSTPADWEEAAKGSADRALQIDEHMALAHMALGIVAWMTRDGDRARAEFRQASDLDPNNIDILDDSARVNLISGHIEEALSQLQRLAQLKPHHVTLAYLLYRAGRLDEAAEEYSVSLATNALDWDDAANFALVEIGRGDLDAAREYLGLSQALGPSDAANPLNATTIAKRCYLYGRIGDSRAAMTEYQLLQGLRSSIRIADGTRARAALGVGDRATALRLLKRAADSPYNDFDAVDLAFDFTNDPTLDSPEFVEVRERLRLR